MVTDHYERRTPVFHSVPVLQVHAKRGLCGEQSSANELEHTAACFQPAEPSGLGDGGREE